MFDVGLGEVIVLVVVALFVFGPDRLPRAAAQAGRALRELRSMAAGARREIQDSMGPEFDEFRDLDLRDLNPRSFVRKQLFEDDDNATARRPRPATKPSGTNGQQGSTSTSPAATPFDADAT